MRETTGMIPAASAPQTAACTRGGQSQAVLGEAWLGHWRGFACDVHRGGLASRSCKASSLPQQRTASVVHNRLTVWRCCSSFKAACKRCVIPWGPTCKSSCHSPPSALLPLMSLATGCTPETLRQPRTGDHPDSGRSRRVWQARFTVSTCWSRRPLATSHDLASWVLPPGTALPALHRPALQIEAN